MSPGRIEARAREMGMVFREEVLEFAAAEEVGLHADGTDPIEIRISPGSSLDNVSEQLERVGILEDSEVFSQLVSRLGLSDRLKAGSYKIVPGEDMYRIVLIITGQERGNDK